MEIASIGKVMLLLMRRRMKSKNLSDFFLYFNGKPKVTTKSDWKFESKGIFEESKREREGLPSICIRLFVLYIQSISTITFS